MEIGNGNGFLKLQEENSRRSSVFIQKPPADLKGGLPYTTRINCGCGECFPFRVKVEKDEGSLRIGRLSLAANCHLILLVFGFCFLLAGSVLTLLAYKTQLPDLANLQRHFQEEESSSRDQEKVAGPLFIIIGSGLVFLGVCLALLGYKLNREARRQRSAQSRFSLESNNPSPTYHAEYFSNLDEVRSQGGDSISNNRSRRGSFFGNSFNPRRSTLATIAQAVPVGFHMSTDSPRTPKSPNSLTNFQEIELSSPTKPGPERVLDGSEENTSRDVHYLPPPEYSKPVLSLRPSLPMPMFGIPNSRMVAPLDTKSLAVNSRSDEPFGSIASLSGTGDIACFPVHWVPPVILTVTVPELEEEGHPSLQVKLPTKDDGRHGEGSGLPPIKVNEFGNALTATQKNGLRLMREVQSEERSEKPDDGPNPLPRRGSQL